MSFSRESIITRTPLSGPFHTRSALANDLRQLGVGAGDTILVHSSLKAHGWVCGGPEAVVLALLEVLGETGTLVVPTFTAGNSEPSEWCRPPISEDWWPVIRSDLPAYDPRTSRTRAMGVIAETVRTWPGAIRSAHPQTSFAAIGPNAKYITDGHVWECRLGEQSPLARLEDLKAKVLLLGVGFERCTAFHLAQYRIPMPMESISFAVMTEKGREWKTVQDTDVPDDGFTELGADFEQACTVLRGKVGSADSRLFEIADAVAFAQKWLPEHKEPAN